MGNRLRIAVGVEGEVLLAVTGTRDGVEQHVSMLLTADEADGIAELLTQAGAASRSVTALIDDVNTIDVDAILADTMTAGTHVAATSPGADSD